MSLYTLEDVEFWIYFHNEGEEFFLHYDYWPHVPPVHHIKRNDKIVDIIVRKELSMIYEGCTNEKHSYMGNYV